MTGGIGPEWLGPLSASGLLGLVVFAIIRGHLVPPRLILRQEHEQRLADMSRERDSWRQLALVTMEQNQKLLTGVGVVVPVLEAFGKVEESR